MLCPEMLPNMFTCCRRNHQVKALESETETKIDLTSTHIFIRGEDVTSAQEKVAELLEQHKHEFAEIPISQELIGRIIGAKGANIKKLGDESGAKIDIDKSSNNVLVRGKPEQVEAAKALIQEIIKTEASRRTQFVVPKEACASIIGKGGETIRRIEGDTNTRLNVDRQSSRVTITGEPDDVIAAKALVDEQVETWTNQLEEKRSKMIMERTREGEDDDSGGDKGNGRAAGRGKGKGNDGPKKPVQPPPEVEPAEPEAEAASKPKLDEPRKISGLGPTRNQLKNKKRSQKRAKQRQQDEALDFLTTSSSTGAFLFLCLVFSFMLDIYSNIAVCLLIICLDTSSKGLPEDICTHSHVPMVNQMSFPRTICFPLSASISSSLLRLVAIPPLLKQLITNLPDTASDWMTKEETI